MGLRRRLRSVLWSVPVEQEVREELAHHVELRTRELVEHGWTLDAARAEAERRVRDTEPILRRLGERRNRAFAVRERLGELRHDIVFALRQYNIWPRHRTRASILRRKEIRSACSGCG